MNGKMKVGIFLLVGVLASGAWAQATAKVSGAAKPASGDKAQSEPVSVTGADYVIGADDMLHISVWKEPDLTESLPVRPDGKVSMPLLNDVTAAGRSEEHTSELQSHLNLVCRL